jgi:polyferredoxin
MSILITGKRRIVQALSLVFLNTNLWALGNRGVCLPILNCDACAVAWLGCPIGMMARSIAFVEIPLLVIGSVVIVGAVMGRFLCGWVCPMGFLQDLLYKIPRPKFRLPDSFKWIKYGVLLVAVVGVACFARDYESSRLFFCRWCPTSALQVVLPNMIVNRSLHVDTFFVMKISVLALVLFLAVAHSRSFCKTLCPVGALVAITNEFSFFSLKLNKATCVGCRKCDRKCPMDVKVMQSRDGTRSINRDAECIGCLACEEACPVSAIGNNSRILHKP